MFQKSSSMFHRRARLAVVAFVSLGVLLLSGCSGDRITVKDILGTPSNVVTGNAKALAAFKTIAKASCDAAKAFGVVETDGNEVLVLVPEEKAYKGYRYADDVGQVAKYSLDENEAAPVTTDDDLAEYVACTDEMTFVRAEGDGKAAAITAESNASGSQFTVTNDMGDGGVWTSRYDVTDGKISKVDFVLDGSFKPSNIIYGPLEQKYFDLLKNIVDGQIKTYGE